MQNFVASYSSGTVEQKRFVIYTICKDKEAFQTSESKLPHISDVKLKKDISVEPQTREISD